MSYAIHYRPGVVRDMARLPKAVLRRMDKATRRRSASAGLS